MSNGSPKYNLNSVDIYNLSKNAALVAVAAGLTYVAQNLGNLELGELGVLVVPVISTAIQSMITWIRDNSEN
tara:strand:- start:322 stop:537 length:216 start_codon:yes stop_codon:yes gene_type:complete